MKICEETVNKNEMYEMEQEKQWNKVEGDNFSASTS